VRLGPWRSPPGGDSKREDTVPPLPLVTTPVGVFSVQITLSDKCEGARGALGSLASGLPMPCAPLPRGLGRGEASKRKCRGPRAASPRPSNLGGGGGADVTFRQRRQD